MAEKSSWALAAEKLKAQREAGAAAPPPVPGQTPETPVAPAEAKPAQAQGWNRLAIIPEQLKQGTYDLFGLPSTL